VLYPYIMQLRIVVQAFLLAWASPVRESSLYGVGYLGSEYLSRSEGRTTEVYTSGATLNLTPHVNAEIRSIVRDWEAWSFFVIFTKWGPYLSFVSTWTSRTLMSAKPSPGS